MKNVFYFLSLVVIVACNQSPNSGINKEKLQKMNDYNKYIFSLKVIDSKNILDSLLKLSDTVFADTATYIRTPKATLYVNNEAGTVDQVFEDPQGTITAMAYYRASKRIYAAEYFSNGLVMCLFSVTDSGIRQGHDTCYYKNGKLRKTGFYNDDHSVSDSSIDYPNDTTE